MSLVNAVHALLDVAAGRRNLSEAEADELHDAIDAGQAPDPTPGPSPSDASVPAEPTPPSTPTDSEAVNLDAPADT